MNNNNNNIKGQVVVITGCSSELGEAARTYQNAMLQWDFQWIRNDDYSGDPKIRTFFLSITHNQ